MGMKACTWLLKSLSFHPVQICKSEFNAKVGGGIWNSDVSILEGNWILSNCGNRAKDE